MLELLNIEFPFLCLFIMRKIFNFKILGCALCKQGRHRQKVSYVTCMFVFDDRQKSYHDGPKSWFHIQLLIGISLDRQMRDRRKSMCKSPIGVCLIGECLGWECGSEKGTALGFKHASTFGRKWKGNSTPLSNWMSLDGVTSANHKFVFLVIPS